MVILDKENAVLQIDNETIYLTDEIMNDIPTLRLFIGQVILDELGIK